MFRHLLLALTLVIFLSGCAPVVAHWQANYADNLTSNGDIRQGSEWVCPDQEECTGTGKYESCTTYPITTWIPVYQYTDHHIVDGTCEVVGVSQ